MDRISSLMAALLALTLPRADADDRDPAVYPVPRQLRFAGGERTLSASATLAGADAADADAVRELRGLLARAAPQGGLARVIVGERGDPAVKAYESGLPEVSGAYKLIAGPDTLALVGHDGRGTFYAVQTLRQLLGTEGRLPAVEITDAPVIPFRGTVEGFYGTPWTHENRLAQFAFYGRHKMNTYIYGPKDDPYHRAPHWRKPYPPEDAERIRKLVRAARANKVDFVWAIHPGGDIRWTEEDARAVLDKFQAMYDLGVRSFAVFFDDIGGEGTDPAKQAELLNRLHREFVQARGDVTPLILCPTQYNQAWSSGDYLDLLGRTLDPSIHVMWTGRSVVADIDRPTMEWINARLRRKAYIWWNFPVSDFVRNHLLMGPAYGNAPEIGTMVSGFVSNPMERAEASKVALYGVAGFTWNPSAYDAQAAWEAAIREVLPKAADAFRTFCAHNSDLGPNGHGYRRDESVAFRPVAERCEAALRSGRPDAAALAEVEAEFARIAAAPAAIRAGADNPRLLEEIGPWLDAFEQLGQAGRQAAAALRAEDRVAMWDALSRAIAHRAAMLDIDRHQNRNPYQPGIRTGSLVVEPLADALLRRAGARLTAALTGRPVMTPTPITNSPVTDDADRMTDEDPASYFYSRQVQKVGDYFGLDLGAEIPVRRVSLVMGRQDGDHDIVHQGQLEASRDSRAWIPLGPATTGERVEWQGGPVPARQVRYRVLHAGKLDGSKNDVWCAFRDFRINSSGAAPRLRTTVPLLAQTPVQTASGSVSLSPKLEVFAFRPGQEIGLEFSSPVPLRGVETDLAADNPVAWSRLEVSTDGRTWRALPSAAAGTALKAEADGSPVRAVRIRNTGAAARDIKLARFAVTLAAAGEAAGAAAWTDGRLETSAPLEARQVLAIPPGTRAAALLFAPSDRRLVRVGVAASPQAEPRPLGTLRTSVAGFPLPASGGYLVLQPETPGEQLHEAFWIGAAAP